MKNNQNNNSNQTNNNEKTKKSLSPMNDDDEDMFNHFTKMNKNKGKNNESHLLDVANIPMARKLSKISKKSRKSTATPTNEDNLSETIVNPIEFTDFLHKFQEAGEGKRPSYKKLKNRPSTSTTDSGGRKATTTMFAAAAVAAAAAFTAISTTNFSEHMKTSEEIRIQKEKERMKRYVSWKNYAQEKRTSKQRRNAEITASLEKASVEGKRKQISNLQAQNLANELASLTKGVQPHQLNTTTNNNANNLNVKVPFVSITNEFGRNTNSTGEKTSEEQEREWIARLSESVFNEFVKNHKIDQVKLDSEILEYASNNQRKLDHTQNHSDFDLDNLHNNSALYEKPEFANELREVIAEYIQNQNIYFRDPKVQSKLPLNKDFLQQPVKQQQQQQLQQQQQQQQPQQQASKPQQNSDPFRMLRHERWDPYWLDISRKLICTPISLILIFVLIYTNTKTDWIHFNGKKKHFFFIELSIQLN
jgi:hypothetical protein